MTIIANTQNQDAIEDMIDKSNLADVLGAIVNICHEKAEHLESNWQDQGAAKLWKHAAKRVETAMINLPNYPMIDH
jgi:hypothetical protein